LFAESIRAFDPESEDREHLCLPNKILICILTIQHSQNTLCTSLHQGDAFYQVGGLEYVLGYAYKEKNNFIYKRLWATSRAEEKKSFEQFMQFVTQRWKQFPKMYIYHFAPYEPSTIKRLARQKTRESEMLPIDIRILHKS
jgi:hypothetical protein